MKKGICILLVYAILMTLLVVAPATANASEKGIASSGELVESGTTGDCTWTLDDKGVLIVSGTDTTGYYDSNKMKSYSTDDPAPWKDKGVTKVIIEDGVRYVGSFSFYECETLTSVDIADSVEAIGGFTFYGCISLTRVILPDNYYLNGGISQSLFNGCTSLKSIDIPEGAHKIEFGAFANSGLTRITLPETVSSVGRSTFDNCSNLQSIVILNPDLYFDDRAGWRAMGYINGEKNYDFTIYGYEGSTAETYADGYGFNFKSIEGLPTLGDADGNKRVESVDSTCIQRNVAGIATQYNQHELINGDVDCSGNLELFDATYIQCYLAEIKTGYPIGKLVA